MGKSPQLVTVERKKIDLSNGQYIWVKKKLNYGETQRLSVGQFRSTSTLADGRQEINLDLAKFSIERICTWVDEWSLDEDITPEIVTNLDPDFAGEIDEALNVHIKALEDEKAKRPNASAASSAPKS